jgi:GTPase SAR1 family protein
MMMLRVNNYKVIKSAEIEVGKTILYGPNSSGKSSIIYALLTLTTSKHPDENIERVIKHGVDEANIAIHHGESFIEYSGKDRLYRCRHGSKNVEGSSIEFVEDCVKEFWRSLGIDRIGHVAIDKMYVFDVPRGDIISYREKDLSEAMLDVEDPMNPENWYRLLSHPEVISGRVAEDLWDICGIERIYGPFVRINGKWLPIHVLSDGLKRAILMIIAMHHSDLLIIEGFENSLHIDLIVYLLNRFEEYEDKKIIIETHSGMVVLSRLMIPERWQAYYVDQGTVRKITKETMKDISQLRSEREAYSLLI